MPCSSKQTQRERKRELSRSHVDKSNIRSVFYVSKNGLTILGREQSTKSRGSRTRTSNSGSRGTDKTASTAVSSSSNNSSSNSAYSNYFALKSTSANSSTSSSSSLSYKFAKWSRKVQGIACGATLSHQPSVEEEAIESHADVSLLEEKKHKSNNMERPKPEKPPRTFKQPYSSNSTTGSKKHQEDLDQDHHTFATATTTSATISYSTDQGEGDASDVSEAGMEVVMSGKDSADMEDVITIKEPYQSHSFLGGKHTFTVDKRYSMIRVIGSGAYGVVVSSHDSKTDKNVAIKMVPKAFSDEIDAKRILREIKLLKHFRHDNIVQIVDMMPPSVPYLEDFTNVYIVADLMETDLHRIIYSKQTLSMDHVQYFVYQVLRGLRYIHSCKVIHRDLKPSNLLVNSNCDLKICDFGLARGIRDKDEDGRGGTMLLTEYVVTRWYRAPEIMLACHEYSYPIDVWSVGCIFAELILRKPFFPGDDYIDQVCLRCVECTVSFFVFAPNHRTLTHVTILSLAITVDSNYRKARQASRSGSRIRNLGEGQALYAKASQQDTRAFDAAVPRSTLGSSRSHAQDARDPSRQAHHCRSSPEAYVL